MSEDTTKAVEPSFYEKHKTEILVGGAIAFVLLFRNELGLGAARAPVAAKE